jgi:cellulose biosynthesis protein BcsE
MNESMTDTATISLGVPGLPTLTDSLMVGGLYVLIAETASARFPILATSLSAGLGRGVQCRIVMPQNPEVFIQRLESFGNLSILQGIEDQHLQLFTMQDEFSKKMFRYGAEAFVRELEHYEFPDGSYVLFDQADDLLSLHDVALALDQVDVLRKWAQAHQITVLLVLTRVTEPQISTINALMDDLTGIVRLGASRNGLELSFDYWQSPEGTIAGRSFVLNVVSAGLYEAKGAVAVNEGMASESRFEKSEEVDGAVARFFYMDPDLGSFAKQMQGEWLRVDTLVSMMHATRNLRAATCILMFHKGSSLRQLAETVHTLRLAMGRYARIVVQEKDASLRYQNEALLLKLGLNLVVNRDVPLSRLPLLLESLKGQIFNRDVDINFEAALASVLPTRLRGYLLPQRFVREAALILDRAETLAVPCALMVGRPTVGETMTDLVVNNAISRAGDLLTADSENCFVFLNACPETVLLQTVERLLGKSVDVAFSSVKFVVDKEEMQAELAALLRSAEREALPDYSDIAAPQPASHLAEDVQAAMEPVQDMRQRQQPSVAPNFPDFLENRSHVANVEKKPVRQEIRPGSRPSTAPVQATLPIAAARRDAGESPLFQYDGVSNVRTLGKKDAPRATRSVQPTR